MEKGLFDRFHEVLSKHSLRRTRPREIIFKVLLHAHEALTLQEIIKQTPSIDRASVYRICETFQDIELLVVVSKYGQRLYELAAPFKPHHHHISCTQCGKILSLRSPRLEQLIEHIAQQKEFIMKSHTLELQGICRQCYSSVS